MSVAPWREAEQRQGAEKRAELVDGAAFHEHQGSGRRAQCLGSGGHRFSFLVGPLICGSRLIDL
jgi:hypothetical protein